MKTTETILFEQLKKHSTDYVESEERGIVVDDLDVDSFIEETSKLLKANELKKSTEKCTLQSVVKVEQKELLIAFNNEFAKYQDAVPSELKIKWNELLESNGNLTTEAKSETPVNCAICGTALNLDELDNDSDRCDKCYLRNL